MTIPSAIALFLSNQIPTSARLGIYNNPAPNPMQIPWLRNTCQYVVLKLSIMMPKTTRKLPATSMTRK
jgi:hypothetical protein